MLHCKGPSKPINRPYAFAKGEIETNGQRLSAPLDFVAITDHAEFLGELDICSDPSFEGLRFDVL